MMDGDLSCFVQLNCCRYLALVFRIVPKGRVSECPLVVLKHFRASSSWVDVVCLAIRIVFRERCRSGF